MAESRRQLIEGSSFLRNEKEKIGGLNVKRSTITGDAFKKGTSQELSSTIDKRVGNNERKITLLKNIFKARKDNVDKKVGIQTSLQGILQSIAESVDSIRDTLIKRQESGEEGAEGRRVRAEQAEFDAREKDLEKEKRFEGLKKVGNRVLAPVKSLWERIWNFIKTLFLGKILLKFLEWIASPANQQKIRSFIRFVKDWWPALLGAVVLFGTGFGAMITNLTTSIALWIPKMLAATKALGAMALAGGRGVWNFGRKAVSAFGATRRFNEGGVVPGSGNSDTVPAMLTPGEVVMNKAAVQKYGADTLLGMNAAAGGKNKISFSGGSGKIRGLPGLGGGGGGTNSLTEQAKVKTLRSALGDFFRGENRMSDHDKWMEMSEGGLVPHFNEGGLVTVEAGTINSYQDAIAAGIPVEDVVAGNMRFGSIRYREKLPKGWFQKQRYQTRNRRWHVSLTGKDDDNILGMSTEDYVNKKMGWVSSPPRPKLDRVTGDPGERTLPKLDRGDNIVGGGAEKAKKSAENISKPSGTGGGGGGGVQVINASQNQQSGSEDGQGGGGDEIPAFEVGTIRDLAKVRTLGIMVM